MSEPDPSEKPVVGHYYLSVECSKCSEIIPLAYDMTEGQKVLQGSGTLRVGCPFCGHSDDYQTTQAVSRKLEKAVPTAH